MARWPWTCKAAAASQEVQMWCQTLEGTHEVAAQREVIRCLVEAVRGGGETMERALALTSLAHALDDPSHVIRMDAAKALGALGERSAVSRLAKMLGDPAAAVRAAAATALGALEAVERAAELQYGCSDDDISVRRASIRALGNLRAEPSIPCLAKRLEDPEREIRFEAALALGSLGEAAVTSLLAAIRSGSKDAKVAALNGLEEMPALNRDDVLQILVAASEDKDWEIRRAATAALQSWQAGL